MRGLRAVHARRAARAGLRDHALFHGQLRAGGVPHAAVPLVDAAPVGAQQAGRNLHRLGRRQADDGLELRPQRPVGESLEQGGGCGRVHAGPGQDPAQVLDHIGAGPDALFLLGQRDCLLRRARHLCVGQRAGRVRAWHVHVCVSPAVPYRWRDRRQAHAERVRELVCPPCVGLRDVECAVLGFACLEVGRLREMCQLTLRRRAAVLRLEPRRAGAQVRGDGLAASGEHAHHVTADALNLEPVAVIARDPFQAEPGGEGFFQVLGDDRGDRADMLVVAQRVRRAPFAVGGGLGHVGDLGVDVQLHVAVAGGVLQPLRDG